MKLATKLVSLFMLMILGVIAVDTVLATRSREALLMSDEKADLVHLGLTLRSTVLERRTARPAIGPGETVARVVADSDEVEVRWVWFDPAAGPDEKPRAAVTPASFSTPDGGIVFHEEQIGAGILLCYVSVVIDGRIGAVELHSASAMLDEVRLYETVHALRMGGIMILLTAVAGVFVGQRIVASPLRRLMEKTRRIGRGDLGGPVAIRGRDELHELGDALNTMCEELASSQAQLRHADRLRTVGQLAAGIAHEVGTPLNVISGRAAMIESGRLDAEDAAENGRTIKEQSDRIAATVRDVLEFARPPTPEYTPTDLRPLARRTVDLLSAEIRKSSAVVSLDLPGTPVDAEVDAGQIQQVITNLVMNALQAEPERVTVRINDTGAGECRIDVEDDGAGMPADVAEKVFEPFFTTKEVGEGTGLGLAVAWGIVREHGGRITVDSTPGRGTTFSVVLPRERAS